MPEIFDSLFNPIGCNLHSSFLTLLKTVRLQTSDIVKFYDSYSLTRMPFFAEYAEYFTLLWLME